MVGWGSSLRSSCGSLKGILGEVAASEAHDPLFSNLRQPQLCVQTSQDAAVSSCTCFSSDDENGNVNQLEICL